MAHDNRPFILISNDDGYEAKGIRALVSMVEGLGDILVCAPDSGRSGASCAFSATTPLLLKRQAQIGSAEVWSSNGTPVDSLKLALSQLCTERRPDIILSGINHGDNSTVNTHYSGTMGVALEGCMKYIPSVAFSLCDFHPDADFEPMRPIVRDIVEKVLRKGLPQGVCLNVNAPRRAAFEGVKLCRMTRGSWINEVKTMHHPRGYDYYWMVGEYRNDEPEAEDTDQWAINNGNVAITPTRIDVTEYEQMEEINEILHHSR